MSLQQSLYSREGECTYLFDLYVEFIFETFSHLPVSPRSLNEIIHDAFEEFRSIEDVGHVVVQYVEFGRDPLPLLELFW